MKALKKYGSFIALALAVLAIVMLFIQPALKYNAFNETVVIDVKVNGFDLIFGKEKVDNHPFLKIDRNVLGLVSLLLLVVGVALPFLNFKPKLQYFIAAALLVVSGILLLFITTKISGTSGKYFPSTSYIFASIFLVLAGVSDLFLALTE